jgi:hypothetical protein
MAVTKDKLRPPIPSNCPKNWVALMTQCWSHSPSLRPTFREIVQYIENELTIDSLTAPPVAEAPAN